MSSISSVGSSATAQYASVGHHRRPDPSKMASDLFSKLDTKGQGYLEKSDLESALSSVSSGSGSSSATADQVFSALDSNGDGKVTQDEMSSSLQKLSEQLNSQFDQSRMSGAMGGGRGPDGDGDQDGGQGKDQGFTKDQLTSIASSTKGSNLSQLMTNLANNFSAADSNGDGKITRDEAMSYQQSANGASGAGGMGGMPPPPGGDQGMTQDQMNAVASSTTDSNLASLLKTVASNFSAADTNGDGKVSAQEAMAYQQSQQSGSSTATSSASSSSNSNANSNSSTSNEAAVMKRIMDLVHAYGNGGNSGGNSGFSQLLGTLSTSA